MRGEEEAEVWFDVKSNLTSFNLIQFMIFESILTLEVWLGGTPWQTAPATRSKLIKEKFYQKRRQNLGRLQLSQVMVKEDYWGLTSINYTEGRWQIKRQKRGSKVKGILKK